MKVDMNLSDTLISGAKSIGTPMLFIVTFSLAPPAFSG
jgi:hypothetical protein